MHPTAARFDTFFTYPAFRLNNCPQVFDMFTKLLVFHDIPFNTLIGFVSLNLLQKWRLMECFIFSYLFIYWILIKSSNFSIVLLAWGHYAKNHLTLYPADTFSYLSALFLHDSALVLTGSYYRGH